MAVDKAGFTNRLGGGYDIGKFKIKSLIRQLADKIMEKFDPKDKQYKEVADLPPENQEEFMDVKGGGFVSREAIINVERAEEMAYKDPRKEIENLRQCLPELRYHPISITTKYGENIKKAKIVKIMEDSMIITTEEAFSMDGNRLRGSNMRVKDIKNLKLGVNFKMEWVEREIALDEIKAIFDEDRWKNGSNTAVWYTSN